MNQASFEEKMKHANLMAHHAEMAAMTLPKRGTCVVDDETALMDEAYFKELKEYSCSVPTGQYVGKRWKKNQNAYRFLCTVHKGEHLRNDECKLENYPENWWMAEYCEDPDPAYIMTKWRRIAII